MNKYNKNQFNLNDLRDKTKVFCIVQILKVKCKHRFYKHEVVHCNSVPRGKTFNKVSCTILRHYVQTICAVKIFSHNQKKNTRSVQGNHHEEEMWIIVFRCLKGRVRLYNNTFYCATYLLLMDWRLRAIVWLLWSLHLSLFWDTCPEKLYRQLKSVLLKCKLTEQGEQWEHWRLRDQPEL